MPAKVLIPAPLRQFTGNNAEVSLEGNTVRELLSSLTQEYQYLHRHLYTDAGELRAYINVYVNNDDIRQLNKESTPVGEKDVISIIPSIAGG